MTMIVTSSYRDYVNFMQEYFPYYLSDSSTLLPLKDFPSLRPDNLECAASYRRGACYMNPDGRTPRMVR